jgi:hypothetical protein
MSSKQVVVTTKKQSDDGLSFGPIIDTFVKLSSSCDKFLNCQYVSKQVEDESIQEKRTKSAVERVWSRLDHSLEVEIYRQFLFEQNSPMPSFEDTDEAGLDLGAHYSSTPPTTPNRILRQRS